MRSAPLLRRPKGVSLDEREVEVIEGRTAESVAAQRAEEALIRPGAAGTWMGMEKKSDGIVLALAEVVLTVLARGGKMRRGDLVGAIDAGGARAGLLDAGEDGKGRAGVDAGDAE